MTKSHITMLGLAKDKAISMGIRSFDGWYGIFLRDEELKKVYAAEKFNVAPGRTIHKRHVLNWELIGECWAMDMDMDLDLPFLVWFAVPEVMIPSLKDYGKRHLLAEEKAIINVTWPALAEKGLVSVTGAVE